MSLFPLLDIFTARSAHMEARSPRSKCTIDPGKVSGSMEAGRQYWFTVLIYYLVCQSTSEANRAFVVAVKKQESQPSPLQRHNKKQWAAVTVDLLRLCLGTWDHSQTKNCHEWQMMRFLWAVMCQTIFWPGAGTCFGFVVAVRLPGNHRSSLDSQPRNSLF